MKIEHEKLDFHGPLKSGPEHQNFIDHMNNNIGRNLDAPSTNLVKRQAFVESKQLASGNIENQYRLGGTCRYYFEVDPRTFTILNWRYEGTKQDCSIVP